jgi:hypothetical protein
VKCQLKREGFNDDRAPYTVIVVVKRIDKNNPTVTQDKFELDYIFYNNIVMSSVITRQSKDFAAILLWIHYCMALLLEHDHNMDISYFHIPKISHILHNA